MNKCDLNKLVRTDKEVDEQLTEAIIIAGCHELIKSENFASTKEELKKMSSIDVDNELKKIRRVSKASKKQAGAKRINNIFMKISACFAVLVLLSIITVVSSEAAQVAFLNTYIKVFDVKTDFTIVSNDGNHHINNEIQQFEYIPSGFELTETFDNDDLYMVTYNNSYDEYVIIKITAESVITVDSEDAEITEKSIGSKDCFITIKDGIIKVVFLNDENGYVITSNISIDEIEKIIKNIK